MMDKTILTVKENTIWCNSKEQIHKAWQQGQVIRKCLKESWLTPNQHSQLNRNVCLFQILGLNFKAPYNTLINIDPLQPAKWKSESLGIRFRVLIEGIGNQAWTLNKIIEPVEARGLIAWLSNKEITVPLKIITHRLNQCQEYSKSKVNNNKSEWTIWARRQSHLKSEMSLHLNNRTHLQTISSQPFSSNKNS